MAGEGETLRLGGLTMCVRADSDDAVWRRRAAILSQWLCLDPTIARVCDALDGDVDVVGGTVRDGLLMMQRLEGRSEAAVVPLRLPLPTELAQKLLTLSRKPVEADAFCVEGSSVPVERGRPKRKTIRDWVCEDLAMCADLHMMMRRGVDLATPYHPDVSVCRLRRAGLSVDRRAIGFGIVLINSSLGVVEVVSYRRERYDRSRFPRLQFEVTRSDDAVRRDFAVNALYIGLSEGVLHDPIGSALDDLVRRCVSFIGEASIRLTEDPVRVIRYLRTAADVGAPDPREFADWDVLSDWGNWRETLSRKRVRKELVSLVLRLGVHWDAVVRSGILGDLCLIDATDLNKLAIESWMGRSVQVQEVLNTLAKALSPHDNWVRDL